MFMRVDRLQAELPAPKRADPDGAAAPQELPGEPQGELEVVDGIPDGGGIHDLAGVACAFTPDYAPEEMFEIAAKL